MEYVLTITEIFTVALAGAFGSFIKDILHDGYLQIPEIKDKQIYLGFLGGALVGAFVGIVIDGSFLTALMAGFTGTSVVAKLAVGRKIKDLEKEVKEGVK